MNATRLVYGRSLRYGYRPHGGEWRRAWHCIGPAYPIGAALGMLAGSVLALLSMGG